MLSECHPALRRDDTWEKGGVIDHSMTQTEPDEARSELLSVCHAVVRDTWEKGGVIDHSMTQREPDEARSALLGECHAVELP